MADREMMSPMRQKPQQAADAPLTPGAVQLGERSIHQPSPNRTEAAAAMMHLLTASTANNLQSSKADTESTGRAPPDLKAGKTKRRYVRKAPKKVGSTAKRQIKTAFMEASAVGRPPANPSAAAASAKSTDEDESKAGDWRMDGDEVRFFPFREYNRKEKSLGLLCENFLKLYRDDKISEICLDRAATQLGVERRRIYDIVNILESIHLVSRKSKNLYNWHGLASLPISIGSMKKRYAETQKTTPAGSNSAAECPPVKDRRRGKSLSKLSQMFVQLFLEKEGCIIPLDQAAKQLIQLEDSKSAEDRQLKTKIRRLYDVANVLVSVGLIEKLQLSSSRKPVFRWKTRSENLPTGSSGSQTGATNDEHLCVKKEETQGHPAENQHPGSTLRAKAEVLRSGTCSNIMEDAEALKTSQSCDSDMCEDGSDCSSESSNGGSKRKQSTTLESDAKRSRLSEHKLSATEGAAPHATRAKRSLLRMDSRNLPVHPQTILHERQEEVKLYMQQYIREYVDYMILHQQQSPGGDDAGSTRGSSHGTPRNAAEISSMAARTESSIAAITQDIHGTPVSLPLLAGSIQDLLLPESPQSVAELLPVVARVVNKTITTATSSPVASEPEPEPHTNRTLSALHATPEKPQLPIAKTALTSSPPTTRALKDDDADAYDAPRNLIKALQPPSPP